jgi:alkaline phosphatase D
MPTRIALASCCKIDGQKSLKVQSAWNLISQAKPDLLLLLGDNVYMRQGGPLRWDFKQLAETYQNQFSEPNFIGLIGKVPYMATWDDHDFGPNDSRGDTLDGRPNRIKSRNLFHKYHSAAINTNRPNVYCSHVIGDVKIIMLDGRYFRTDRRRSQPTILGSKQEAWLQKELVHSSKYTVVCSGSCLTQGGETDSWLAYPEARQRLIALLNSTPRLLFLSGDIHRNMFASVGSFYEVISSSVARNEDDGPRENFGVIDFLANEVRVRLSGVRHKDRILRTIRSSDWVASAA